MIRPELSYANVMSSIAVFLALGGTSYAVAKNSVGEKQLKANAVTSPKIKDGAVTAADLAPGAAVSGPRGPRGEQGPKGESAGSNSEIVVRQRDGRVTMGYAAGSGVDVLTFTLPRAGKWLVRTEAQPVYFPHPNTASNWFDCKYTIDGVPEPEGRQKGVHLGNAAAASYAGQVSHTAYIDATGPTSVVFRCIHTGPLPVGDVPPFVERAVGTALLVDQADYQDVG